MMNKDIYIYIYIVNELRKSQNGSISRMCGGGTMHPITMNFAKVNEVPIVIIYTKFGEDRSISLFSSGSRILPLCLHLTTSHYNIACTTVQLVIYSDLGSSINLQPKPRNRF